MDTPLPARTTLPRTPLSAESLAPYRLRLMTLDDVPAVMALEARCFPSVWSEKGYRHELTHNQLATYQVLERTAPQPGLVGYAGHWLILDEVTISTIAVDPALRGRGLGALLLLNALWLGIQAGATTATLEVRVGNTTAQSLYRRLEFKTVGRRKRYYKDTGEDALLMTAGPLDAAFRERLARQQRSLLARLRRATME